MRLRAPSTTSTRSSPTNRPRPASPAARAGGRRGRRRMNVARSSPSPPNPTLDRTDRARRGPRARRRPAGHRGVAEPAGRQGRQRLARADRLRPRHGRACCPARPRRPDLVALAAERDAGSTSSDDLTAAAAERHRRPSRTARRRRSTSPAPRSPDASTTRRSVADTAARDPTRLARPLARGRRVLPPASPTTRSPCVRAVRAELGDGARIAVDSSGAPLAALVQSGERIDLVKPNAEELAELVGGDPEEYERDLDAAVAGAQRAAAEENVGTVLLTLGSAGAVLATDRGRVRRRGTEDRRPLGPSGAGDSSLAGYLLAEVAGAVTGATSRTGRVRHRCRGRSPARQRRAGTRPHRPDGGLRPGARHAPGTGTRLILPTPPDHPTNTCTTARPAPLRRSKHMSADSSPRLISAQLVGLDEDLGATSATSSASSPTASPRPAAPPTALCLPMTPLDAKPRRHGRTRRHRHPALPLGVGHRTGPGDGAAPQGVFGAKDGPADIIFFIAAPEGADQEHLKLLSKLARSLINEGLHSGAARGCPRTDIVDLVEGAAEREAGCAAGVGGERPPRRRPAPLRRLDRSASSPSPPAPPASRTPTWRRLPRGRGQGDGVDLQVETQGSCGLTPLDPAVIAAADAVIFAVDVDVREGKGASPASLYHAPVKRGIDEPAKMVEEALAAADDPHAHRAFRRRREAEQASEQDEHLGTGLKRGCSPASAT